MIKADDRLAMHLRVVERCMDLADLMRQFPTDDEDLKLIEMLGMRLFNAFGASLKLALSGYGQNSALIMRDVLETVFLLDLFRGDVAAITRWRAAESKNGASRNFRHCVCVRRSMLVTALLRRNAPPYTSCFPNLPAHPTMKSVFMMRPQKNGDAVIGPFLEKTALEAVLSEMGRLAI